MNNFELARTLRNTCPFCRVVSNGGMSLVRHLHECHRISYEIANELVDSIYKIHESTGSTVQELKSEKFPRRCKNNPKKQEFLDALDQQLKKILESS